MTYKFSDIAINSVEKRLPTESDKSLYIGLEHLVSGSLSVPSCGSPVPLKGEKLVMKKGDVLFGKRNTYLRRASIAPHDGLFSAHGMILRPKTDVVDAAYFPFFVNSDVFFDATIKISVGSLSPTVNWKDMKELEFDLPPLDRQKELAELLWAANNLKESYVKMIVATDELLKAKFREMFVSAKAWPTKPLKEISQYYNGLTYKPGDVSDSGVVVLRSSNIQDGALAFDDIVRVNTDIKEKLWVKDGDILMCSRNGSAALVGKVALIQGLKEEMTFGAFMMIIRSQYSEYLFQYFQSKAFKDQIKGSQSSVMNQITGRMLDAVVVPLPPLALQQQFVEIARKADETKAALKKSIADVEQIIKGIING